MYRQPDFDEILKDLNICKKDFMVEIIDIFNLYDITPLINRLTQLYMNGLSKAQLQQLHLLKEYVYNLDTKINSVDPYTAKLLDQ